MHNPEHIIRELERYIENAKHCSVAAKELIDRYGEEGNYIKATECQVSYRLYEMTAMRLKRILDGLPAFDEPMNSCYVGNYKS